MIFKGHSPVSSQIKSVLVRPALSTGAFSKTRINPRIYDAPEHKEMIHGFCFAAKDGANLSFIFSSDANPILLSGLFQLGDGPGWAPTVSCWTQSFIHLETSFLQIPPNLFAHKGFHLWISFEAIKSFLLSVDFFGMVKWEPVKPVGTHKTTSVQSLGSYTQLGVTPE